MRGAATFTLERTRKRNTDRVQVGHTDSANERERTLLCATRRGHICGRLELRLPWVYINISTLLRLRNDKMKNTSTNLWATMRFWRSLHVWAPGGVWQTEHQGRKYLQPEKKPGQRPTRKKEPGNCWVTPSTCSCFNIWWNVCLMKESWIDRDAFR